MATADGCTAAENCCAVGADSFVSHVDAVVVAKCTMVKQLLDYENYSC